MPLRALQARGIGRLERATRSHEPAPQSLGRTSPTIAGDAVKTVTIVRLLAFAAEGSACTTRLRLVPKPASTAKRVSQPVGTRLSQVARSGSRTGGAPGRVLTSAGGPGARGRLAERQP